MVDSRILPDPGLDWTLADPEVRRSEAKPDRRPRIHVLDLLRQ